MSHLEKAIAKIEAQQKGKEGTAVEEKLKSKLLYKVHLYILKVIPMVMAFCYLLNSIFSYYDIDLGFLSYLSGCSILMIVYLYIASYVFKFCEYHRMFIHYTTITWILNIIDLYIGIPISDVYYLGIQLIIAGISLFIILYLYMHRKK